MPRSLVFGNGNMLVNIDEKGSLRDFYFPFVGLEEHTTGHMHRVGIFDEETGLFTWLHEGDWEVQIDYLKETLVGNTRFYSPSWQLEIVFNDFVTARDNIFCRQIKIKNLSNTHRKLRFFFHYDFHIYGNKSNDTVFFAPGHNALVYYNRKRYFLVNATKKNGIIDQYATGKTEYQGLEGTWKDAEDGKLEGNPITQGSVDATFGLNIPLDPLGENEICTWVALAESLDEAYALDFRVKQVGIEKMLTDTQNYWSRWVNKRSYNFDNLPSKIVELFKQSLLIVRTQIDNHGAIIAANDTDIMKFNKDTYSYMWPRDGALVAHAMDNAGYTEVTKAFFIFCSKVKTKEGYLLHKYNADFSLGSSWHPWIFEDCPQSPLQEDETALPLMALWNHYKQVPDIEFLHYMYDNFVKTAADFLVDYRDEKTGLPLASYDLWEEHKGVFTFTVSSVYAGLKAAGNICDALGSFHHRDKYFQAAEEIKTAALKYLFDEKTNRFLKKVTIKNGEVVEKDFTMDASIAGVFLFGLLPANDPRVVSTMKEFPKKLWVNTKVGGIARYEKDFYQRSGDYPANIPGNPWIITTLWYAQWCFLAAENCDDPLYIEGYNLLNWATDCATKSKILPEQLDAISGHHLSVSPLTWSHAVYIDTVIIFHKKMEELGMCKINFIGAPKEK